MPLTVLIPCRNERRNIRACIESARLVADEVIVADSSNINVRFGSDPNVYDLLRQDNGVNAAMVNTDWNAIFKAVME